MVAEFHPRDKDVYDLVQCNGCGEGQEEISVASANFRGHVPSGAPLDVYTQTVMTATPLINFA